MSRYRSLIQKCDEYIRTGRAHEARSLLSALTLSRVPREARLHLARSCRRTGLHSKGLRLLWNVLHPDRGGSAPATPAEVAEYGALLLRTGAISEALTKLETVRPADAPEASLFQAYGLFLRWDYEAAVPLLEAYINSNISEYASAVGRTNLALAHIELRQHSEALAILDGTIDQLMSSGHNQLLSSCRALRAQALMQEKNFVPARKELAEAQKVAQAVQSNDQFLIQKLQLVLTGLESKTVDPFAELSRLAFANHDWESLREADLLRLGVEFDHVRFLHLLFGTQFSGFHRRLQKDLGAASDRAVFVLGAKTAPRLDIQTGELNGRALLRPGSKIHQLIGVLLRDFYRPLRVGGLFAELFPSEVFDINTSPDRVHQLLRRTRRWLEEEQIPVQIDETEGFFSLKITGHFSFALPRDRFLGDSQTLQIKALRRAYGDANVFKASEARQVLGISKSSMFRLSSWAVETGKLERLTEDDGTVTFRLAAA